MATIVQQWYGWVDTYEAGDHTFLARLTPIVGEGDEVWVTVYLDSLPEDQRGLIAPGVYLHWAITDDGRSDFRAVGTNEEFYAWGVASGGVPGIWRKRPMHTPATAPARLTHSPTGVQVLVTEAGMAFGRALPSLTPPGPLVVAGSDLYGFASADSDYDVRGVYVVPARALLGLRDPALEVRQTFALDPAWGGGLVDLVVRDLGAYLRLLIGKKDINALEWLAAAPLRPPGDIWRLLVAARRRLITASHRHAYAGFAGAEWRRVMEHYRPAGEVYDRTRFRLKPLLYTFRLLLAGCFLLEEGEIEPRLPVLAEHYHLHWLIDLITAKVDGGEAATLDALPEGYAFYDDRQKELYNRLNAPPTLRGWPEKVPDAVVGYLGGLLVEARLAGETGRFSPPDVASLGALADAPGPPGVL